MNVLRVLILIGNLGRVWAVTRQAKNIYQTIAIVAYFKMMDDIEKSRPVFIKPDINPEAFRRYEQANTTWLQDLKVVRERKITKILNSYK